MSLTLLRFDVRDVRPLCTFARLTIAAKSTEARNAGGKHVARRRRGNSNRRLGVSNAPHAMSLIEKEKKIRNS
jgi:hypothetical protein